MEFFEKQNFNWSNITDDFKKMQQISGLIASTSILLSIFVIMTSDIPNEKFINVWYTIGLVGLFTVIYYLFPRLYANKKLQFLPDLIFVLGIASMMLNLQDSGQFFYIFLLLILSINAFSMPKKLYLLSFFEILGALFLVHYAQGHINATHVQKDVLFELYGVLAFGIVLRVFATETVSLRKKQEELSKRTKLLSDQKKQIYLLIDNISEGLIAVDKDKKITFLNKSSLKVMGVIGSLKKFIGKDLDDLLLLTSTEGNISIADEVMKSKKSIIRDDLRFVKHDKTLRLHTNAAPVFDDQQNVVGAILLFRDITGKVELAEQKAEFNAIASHELRTPLTVIEGFLYYMLTDNNLKYDKKTKLYLEKTHDSAKGLLQLSNDILTVVKSEENKIEIALEEIDLEKVINEVVANLQSKAKEKKLKLTTKIPNNLGMVTSDRQKVKEITNNLIENAIKFTDKGSIRVEVKEFPGKESIISVTDTGIGISRDDQKMIFQKFYRAEDWQTRKTGGTGLGLYIAKSFVKRLGGEIGLESKKGTGSTFWFSVPHQVKKINRRKKNNDQKLNEFIQSI